jgi:hypothetical protein
MATVGYGHNIGYNLRQNTATDVLVSVWKPDYTGISITITSSTISATFGLSLPSLLGYGLIRQYGSSANYDLPTSGIGVGQSIHFSGGYSNYAGWYSNPGSYMGVIYSITKYNANAAAISPTTYKTNAALWSSQAYASSLTYANTLLSPLNSALSTDGKLMSVRLSAADTNTLGMLQLEVGVFYATSVSGSPIVSCFPFDPVVFCVTADGGPPASQGSTAILNSIYADTTALKGDTTILKADTTTLKGDTGLLKTDTASILMDTTALLSDTSTIKSGITTTQTSIANLNKAVVNSTKIDINTNRYIIYDDDGLTPLYSYDLFDRSGNPASTAVFNRRKRP